MSDDLFEQIVESCREFPLQNVEPFLNGEPLVDPKIMQRMEYIRRRLPNTRLRLFTNGYALTPSRIDELSGIGLDRLTVSVNTLDKMKYREIMGFGLDRLLENLSYLTDPVRKGKVARRITFRMTRLPTTSLEEQNSFVKFCKKRGVRYTIKAVFNYKGDKLTMLPVPSYPCEHIDRLDILSNGTVALCCMDHNGEYALGDVKKESVLSIFNGEASRRYQMNHRHGRRNEITPCNVCNLSTPSLRCMPWMRTTKFAVQVGYYYLRHGPAGRRVNAPIFARDSITEKAPLS